MRETLKAIVLLIPTLFCVQSAISQTPGCATPSFSAAQHFSVGSGPLSVTSGDFNRDGNIDLATANRSNSNVTVRFGNGTGGFPTAQNFGVASGPYSVTSGDFNGDGSIDLATANAETSNVSVLFGNGSGGFSAPSNFGTGPSPFSLEAGDMNLDGSLDIVTTNIDDNTVSVLLGNGLGGFAAAQHTVVGFSPFDLTIADFNNDGKIDVAVASPFSDRMSFLRGDGLGGFVAPVHFVVGGGPTAIEAGDFNGDDKMDLATANQSSNTVSFIYGNGFGLFATPQNFATGNAPSSLALGDLNSDGKLDIAAANRDSGNVTVLLGDAAGQFPVSQNFAVGNSPASLTAVDLNRDGKLDIATSNISVILNTCDATPCGGISWSQSQPQPTNFFINTVSLGDFNRDGNLDLIGGQPLGDRFAALYGDGLGGLAAPLWFNAGDGANSAAIGDINRDGRSDVVVANMYDDTVSVFRTLLIGTFLPRENFAVGDFPGQLTLADVNSDGKPDIITPNVESDNVSVLLNTCAGYMCTAAAFAPAQHFAAGETPNSVAAGDFDRNGTIDLVVTNRDVNMVALLRGDGTGQFSAPLTFGVGTFPTDILADDFNFDGKLDIVAVNYHSGNLSVLLGNGAGGFAAAQNYPTAGGSSFISNDFNLDGKQDIAIANEAAVSVLFGNGNGGFAAPVSIAANNPDALASGDLNRDGRPDIVTDAFGVLLNTCIVDQPPVANDDSYAANINGGLTVNASGVLANDTDLYNDPLNAVLVSTTAHGDLALNPNGSFTYTPNTGFFGTDTFTYRANDGRYTSGNAATVSIIVSSVNAVEDAVNILENSVAAPIDVLVNDFDGIGTPSVTSITQTSHGTAAITGGGTGISYTPDPNYFGADSFTYTITGQNGATDTATVSIAVNPPAGCGVFDFTGRNAYDVGAYPVWVADGDFNRDGSPDLVTANYNGGTISVLMNNGTGIYGPAQNYGRGTPDVGTRRVISADLNSDGFVDIVAANPGIDHVSVHLGNGSGGFVYLEAGAGDQPTSVAAADFNSDGKPDLAVTNDSTDKVSLLIGYGSGAFQSPLEFDVADRPVDIITADFNHDGKPDVATGNASGSISILLGNGTGGFAAVQTFNAPSMIRTIDVGDLNHDGNLDILAAIHPSGVAIFAGDGNGAFAISRTFNDVTVFPTAAVGDFNGDQRTDFVVTSSNHNPSKLFLGDAAGDFKSQDVESLSYQVSVAPVDVNADGYPDLVATHTDNVNWVVTTLNTCSAVSRFESDVARRPWGDGVVQTDDVNQVRKFLTAAASPDVSDGEFQRADSAPAGSGGEGVLDSTDVVQARRYAVGADAIQAAAGPTEAVSTEGLKHAVPEGAARQIEIVSGQGGRNALVTLNVLVDAESDESEYAFTINYDPAVLTDPVLGTGNSGASAQNCSVYPLGRSNCSVGEFPNNNPSSSTSGIGEIAAVSDQILMTVTFRITTNAPSGFSPVTITHAGAANDAAGDLPVSAIDGTVRVLVPTAASVSVSGRVLTDAGRGLISVVTITDMNGNQRSARTNPFGYFTFANVEVGEIYVMSVASKGYSFTPQTISVIDEITDLVFTPGP